MKNGLDYIAEMLFSLLLLVPALFLFLWVYFFHKIWLGFAFLLLFLDIGKGICAYIEYRRWRKEENKEDI